MSGVQTEWVVLTPNKASTICDVCHHVLQNPMESSRDDEQGLADLEADYRKVIRRFVASLLRRRFVGKGGVAPRVVFVLGLPNGVIRWMQRVKRSSPNFARRCNEPDEALHHDGDQNADLGFTPHPADVRRDRPVGTAVESTFASGHRCLWPQGWGHAHWRFKTVWVKFRRLNCMRFTAPSPCT